jgi:hypothetical protein
MSKSSRAHTGNTLPQRDAQHENSGQFSSSPLSGVRQNVPRARRIWSSSRPIWSDLNQKPRRTEFIPFFDCGLHGARANDRLQSEIRNRTCSSPAHFLRNRGDVPQDPVNLRRHASAGFTAPFVHPSVRRSTFEGAARLPPARLALPNFQRTLLFILYCTTTATLRRAPLACTSARPQIANLKSAI